MFKKNGLNGEGAYRCNQYKYIGSFVNHKRDGKGVLTVYEKLQLEDGTVLPIGRYKGIWKEDKLVKRDEQRTMNGGLVAE